MIIILSCSLLIYTINRTTKNQAIIPNLKAQRAFLNRAKLLPIPDAEDVTTIKDFLSFPQQKTYSVQGRTTLLDKSQKLWYYACPQCHKSLRSQPNWPIICTSCQKHINVVTRFNMSNSNTNYSILQQLITHTLLNNRCKLTIQLTDNSGTLTLDLYAQNAEQLLPFIITDLQKQENQVYKIQSFLYNH